MHSIQRQQRILEAFLQSGIKPLVLAEGQLLFTIHGIEYNAWLAEDKWSVAGKQVIHHNIRNLLATKAGWRRKQTAKDVEC